MGKHLRLVDDLNDDRGTILVFTDGERDYLLIYTNEGYMRGGEVHTGAQYNSVLKGLIKWDTPDSTTILSSATVHVTQKETPHMMESLTDSLMVEWRENPLENPVNYHEPYRSLVKKRVQEKKS